MFVLQAELLDPAVNGTLNVLRSCKKASIKRVVVTSSMAAVAYNGKPKTPDVVVDETCFSSADFCEKNQVVCLYVLIALWLFFIYGVVNSGCFSYMEWQVTLIDISLSLHPHSNALVLCT
jgi:hypothetical protein